MQLLELAIRKLQKVICAWHRTTSFDWNKLVEDGLSQISPSTTDSYHKQKKGLTLLLTKYNPPPLLSFTILFQIISPEKYVRQHFLEINEPNMQRLFKTRAINLLKM